MEIEELILRSEVYSPFTTKGSALTFSEIDNNIIAIANAIIAINNPSSVDAWDVATGYASGRWVRHDSLLWRNITVGTLTGITPGTDPTKWQRVSIGEIVHPPNRDTKLRVASSEVFVEATDIKSLIDDKIYQFAVTLEEADILALNTTPVAINASPGAGFAWVLISCDYQYLYGGGSVAYATNVSVGIRAEGSSTNQALVSNLLDDTVASAKIITLQSGDVIEDVPLEIYVPGGDPTDGNVTVKISGLYRKIIIPA